MVRGGIDRNNRRKERIIREQKFIYSRRLQGRTGRGSRSRRDHRRRSRGHRDLAIVANAVPILAKVGHVAVLVVAVGLLEEAEFLALRGKSGRRRRRRLGLGRRAAAHDLALEAFLWAVILHHALHVGIGAEGVAKVRRGGTATGVPQVVAFVGVDMLDEAELVRVVAQDVAVDRRGLGRTWAAAVMFLLVAHVKVVVVKAAEHVGIEAAIVAPYRLARATIGRVVSAAAATAASSSTAASALTTTTTTTLAALPGIHSAALSEAPPVVGRTRRQRLGWKRRRKKWWWRQRSWRQRSWRIRPRRWAGIETTRRRRRWLGMATAITLAGALAPSMDGENVVFVVRLKVTLGTPILLLLVVLLVGPRPTTEQGGKPGSLGRMHRCGGGANKDQCPEEGGSRCAHHCRPTC